jgi:hypothetical protein
MQQSNAIYLHSINQSTAQMKSSQVGVLNFLGLGLINPQVDLNPNDRPVHFYRQLVTIKLLKL